MKFFTAFFCFLPMFGVVGCVGQSAYEKKAVEASSLSRDLAEAQRKNSELVRENEGLRADVSGLRVKVDELENTRKRLEQTISSGEQSPYQVVAQLEREKGQLREDLAKALRTQDERVRSSSRIYEHFLDRMKDEIASGTVRVAELRGTIRLEFLESAFFEGARTDVSSQGVAVLRKVAELLKDSGNVDAAVESSYLIPAAGPDSSNNPPTPWQVPLRRSLAVARYLSQSGIDPAAVSTMTRGRFALVSQPGLLTDKAAAAGIALVIVVKE